MDGKGYISNPYLSSSSILSNYHKILITDSVKKEFQVLKEKLIEEIYTKFKEDLTREIYNKLKCELDSIRKDEWERIGSPDIK